MSPVLSAGRRDQYRLSQCPCSRSQLLPGHQLGSSCHWVGEAIVTQSPQQSPHLLDSKESNSPRARNTFLARPACSFVLARWPLQSQRRGGSRHGLHTTEAATATATNIATDTNTGANTNNATSKSTATASNTTTARNTGDARNTGCNTTNGSEKYRYCQKIPPPKPQRIKLFKTYDFINSDKPLSVQDQTILL